jgi:FMN phosphatase YigB (HAD superfamily)
VTTSFDVAVAGARRPASVHALPAAAPPPLHGRLHSFDVFDTLVTRITWRPEDVFLLLGDRLRAAGLLHATPEEFAAHRIFVESALRASPGVEEVDLHGIYAELAAKQGWDTAEADRAKALEVEMEASCIRPIATNVARLEALQAAGAEVALLSDTYLDQPSLLRLLSRGGVTVPAERVFASAPLGATKRTGRLFHHVAGQLGLAPGQIRHFGDHPHSDLASPRQLGVDAVHWTEGHPTRHEQALHLAGARHPALLRSLVAGAARAARLSADLRSPHERTLWKTGTTVAGPLMSGFVLWVLQRARALGEQRVHFVARDGQVLKAIAEVLLARLGWNISCSYLHGSRQAWHLPALDGLDETVLSWLADDAPQEPLRSILARADLRAEALAVPLARHGLGGPEALNRAAPARRLRAFLAEPEVEAALRAAGARRRTAALGYLRQEGIVGAPSALIVDLGWHGRLQRSLRRLIELDAGAGTGTRLTGLYLALRSRPEGFGPSEMQAFIEDPRFLKRMNPVLLEIFCSADHGTTRGYRERADGGFAAELAEETDERALAWGLRTLQGGMLAFARELAEAISLAGCPDTKQWTGVLRDAGIAAYDDFRRDPDEAEALAFGSFQHADGQSHDAWRDCAPRVDSLTRLRLAFGMRVPGYAGHWPEASVRRDGGRLGDGLAALKRLRTRLLARTASSRA